jgi:hypothetical protein
MPGQVEKARKRTISIGAVEPRESVLGGVHKLADVRERVAQTPGELGKGSCILAVSQRIVVFIKVLACYERPMLLPNEELVTLYRAVALEEVVY